MSTTDEKFQLTKLLDGLDVPEVKVTERCYSLVAEFKKKFGKDIEEEMEQQIIGDNDTLNIMYNPYKVDAGLLEETEQKLKELATKRKLPIKSITITNDGDPKRPWRTHSCKEKLLRIDNELKRHDKKALEAIKPLSDGELKELVKECEEETAQCPLVNPTRVNEAVDATKKILTNFQYNNIENSTAVLILESA